MGRENNVRDGNVLTTGKNNSDRYLIWIFGFFDEINRKEIQG